MNEIITVNYDNNRPTVLGRDLHELLEVQTPYHKWFPRMAEYGFIESVDYMTMDKNVLRSDGVEMPQTQKDHQLTIEMAKEQWMQEQSTEPIQKKSEEGESEDCLWKHNPDRLFRRGEWIYELFEVPALLRYSLRLWILLSIWQVREKQDNRNRQNLPVEYRKYR